MSADTGIWKRFSDGSIRLFDVLLQESTTGTILDSLARIVGETLGVDRSLILDVSLTHNEARAVSMWLNPAHPEVTPTKASYPVSLFPATARYMRQTHDTIESQADAPHPTFIEDAAVPLIHGTMKIQSLLWYPFMFRDDGFYLFAFNHVVSAHRWTNPELEFMKTATRHVSMALYKNELEGRLRARTAELLQANEILTRREAMLSAAERELRRSLTEKEILLHEIHHRVRNNLQLIISLLNLQVGMHTHEPTRLALIESENRVQSIALAHELLYESVDLASIDFGDYLHAVARQVRYSYGTAPNVEVIVMVRDVRAEIESAVSAGLIVTELLSNALLHAFPDARNGHVWIGVRDPDHAIELEVRDDGVGMAPGTSEGFGLHIVRALADRLGGTMAVDRTAGTTVRVVFPSRALREAPAAMAAP